MSKVMILLGALGQIVAIVVAIALLARADQLTRERYSSVDELGLWSVTIAGLSKNIEKLIESEQSRLTRLKKIKQTLVKLQSIGDKTHEDRPYTNALDRHSRVMLNPVNAFVILNRLHRTVENLIEALNGSESVMARGDNGKGEGEVTLAEIKAVIYDLGNDTLLREDLVGTGQALLRLQSFYHLNVSRLVNGNVANSISDVPAYHMDEDDCFELGKIAHESGQYAKAIMWFYAALEQSVGQQRETLDDDDDAKEALNSKICDILDYMAYAAYELDFVEYSAKLTEAWLERDPDNERARENLILYYDELSASERANSSSRLSDMDAMQKETQSLERRDTRDEAKTNAKELGAYKYSESSIDNYQVEDDEIVSWLCRRPSESNPGTKDKCEMPSTAMLNGHFYPGLKVEVLNSEPRIIRLHEIITEKEAAHLRDSARPKLERSTIMSSSGSRSSEFRIAKTAWLRGETDPIAGRLERRLGSVLNLGIEKSEFLQVVNYGLGGFYGPHLDAARSSSAARHNDSSILLEQLKRSDRLATILIYLNHVDAGGATVFPRLNLTVESIRLSAVVWFNILDSGHSDERTLHTGCPVLLGSKWIATKWLHEEANSFKRPCGHVSAIAS